MTNDREVRIIVFFLVLFKIGFVFCFFFNIKFFFSSRYPLKNSTGYHMRVHDVLSCILLRSKVGGDLLENIWIFFKVRIFKSFLMYESITALNNDNYLVHKINLINLNLSHKFIR